MATLKYLLLNLLIFVGATFVFLQMPIQDWKRALGIKDRNTRVEIKPLSHDFGKVALNKPVVNSFFIKNIGNNELTIKGVEKECYCVIDSFPNEPIKPGDTGKIKLGYDASQEGFFQKVISIKMNIPEEYITIIIKGRVYKQVDH